MIPKDNHVLTETEIGNLKNQGHGLDEKKMYVIKFLFNDKWNQAADPRPFRIKTSLVEKLAKDSIGMPYVYNPKDSKKHIRGTTEGKKDTAQDLLEIQAKYAIGEIKVPLITSSKNVYGIIEIWPEFEKLVEEKKLPEFTSLTIYPMKEDPEGVEEAQFLNLNAVDVPGYSKILAGITGVCKAGIRKCMEELAPLAASGSLNDSRNNSKSFSILKSKLGISMSAEEGKSTPSNETMAKDIDGLKQNFVALEQKVSGIDTKLDAIASKVGADTPKKDDAQNPPAGAAGKQTFEIPKELAQNEFVKNLVNANLENSKKIKAMEDDLIAREEKRKQEIRNSQATSIVEKLIETNKVKAENKDKEIKKYFELKNEDGSLKDLELLDNFLKSEPTPKPVGASGYDNVPDFSGDKTDEVEITNSEIMRFN